MVFAWVVAGKVCGGDVGDGFGVDADDLETSVRMVWTLWWL